MLGPLRNQPVRRAIIAVFGVLMWSGATTVLSQNTAKGRGANPPNAAAAKPTRAMLVDLMLQLESLQRELRELRGQVEVQNHELDQLRQRERDLLTDIDRRLRNLERRGTTTVPYAPPNAAAVPSAPPAPIAPTAPGAPRGAAAPLPAAAQEQQDYDAAFNLLKQGYYERAAKSFSKFIRKHPRSALADNAQYWVGEASYVVRNFRVALDEFQKVLALYPSSSKVSDAMLKMGYSYYELSAYDKARATLEEVVRRFPNTTAAKAAENRLKKMEREGR